MKLKSIIIQPFQDFVHKIQHNEIVVVCKLLAMENSTSQEYEDVSTDHLNAVYEVELPRLSSQYLRAHMQASHMFYHDHCLATNRTCLSDTLVQNLDSSCC